MNANIWDSSADRQSHNDESYSCHSALGETAQFNDNLTNSFMFSFIVFTAKGHIHLGWQFLRARCHLKKKKKISQRENRLRFHYLS